MLHNKLNIEAQNTTGRRESEQPRGEVAMVSKAINSFSRVWTFVNMIKKSWNSNNPLHTHICTHTNLEIWTAVWNFTGNITIVWQCIVFIANINKYNFTVFFMIPSNVTSKVTGPYEIQYSDANLEQCITPTVFCSDGLSSAFWSTTGNSKIQSQHSDGALHHYLICLFQK